jgi:hypothetical protein
MLRELEKAIQEHEFVNSEPNGVPDVAESVSLVTWNNGLHCLRAETTKDAGALIYQLTWQIYRLFGANIYGLAAHTGRESAYVSIYHYLLGLTLDQAQEIVSSKF